VLDSEGEMAVEITRLDLSAADLRREAARSQDAKAARRMLAVALVLEGHARGDAARSCGMDRQTLRDWVHSYNAEGVTGLSNRERRNGPQPRLSEAQKAEVARWVEAGPDLAEDGVVRWRRVDLRARIEREFAVTLHERTVGKLLSALEFSRISVRPQHPQSDPEAQELFKKSLPTVRKRSYLRPATSRLRSGSPMRRVSASRAR
jgi:transposase